MRVFVLGAGASLHVGYPLVKELGRELVRWIANNPPPRNFPYWPDPDELEKCGPIEDIEEIIARLEQTAGSGPILAGLREAICSYFDSIRANGASLYRQFASEVVQPGDVLITFNYDVSLERELRRAGKWEINDGYGFDLGIRNVPKSSTTILKLHGSTNWIDSLFGGMRAGTFSQGYGWDSLGFRPVVLPREFAFLGYEGVTDPKPVGGVTRSGSMVLMSRNKRFYVSTSINPREREPFWSTLWGHADTALRDAGEVVIIGYSLPEADVEARRLLLETANKHSLLTVCCGRDTNRVGDEFAQNGFPQVRTDTKRFEDWLAVQCLEATSTAKCA
jgi:hypothetical protein